MKKKILILVGIIIGSYNCQIHSQSCRDLFRDANQLFQEGKLEKAKTKYQQVVNCGDNFYLPDSKERINWINRATAKPNKAKPFSISDNEIVIPYQGGQDVITVDGDGSWTASVDTSGQDWCKIKKEKGKVYIISDANENSYDRACEINITMGGKSKTVTVINNKAPEVLVPAVENVTFPSQGETNTIEIRSNTDWQITEAPGWIITTKEDGKITLTAQANGDNKDRKAEIKIESTAKTIIINIYQGAGLDHLAFSKNDLHFGPDGGDEYINVYTDADDWRFGDFPHWCQVTKEADNLIRVHCTPNDPINLSREASVNVTTGKQTLGINVSQEAKPFVAVIPDFGIGGRAISFGVSAGYVNPVISASSGGDFTGSVVNYALGNSDENASYSASGGFNVGAFADIRLFKNFYIKTGVEYTHYSYKNEFNKTVKLRFEEDIKYYWGGPTNNSYKEEYSFNQLDIPILVSYRISTGHISHVQLNVGPVIHYGLTAEMELSGNTNSDDIRAYTISNLQYTDQLYFPLIDKYSSVHYAGSGLLDLYSKHFKYTKTVTEGFNSPLPDFYNLDISPLKKMNVGVRIGAAFEYAGVSLNVEYNLMLTNMANNDYWGSDRLCIFNQTPGVVMSGYKQRNSYLAMKLAYTFRY